MEIKIKQQCKYEAGDPTGAQRDPGPAGARAERRRGIQPHRLDQSSHEQLPGVPAGGGGARQAIGERQQLSAARGHWSDLQAAGHSKRTRIS